MRHNRWAGPQENGSTQTHCTSSHWRPANETFCKNFFKLIFSFATSEEVQPLCLSDSHEVSSCLQYSSSSRAGFEHRFVFSSWSQVIASSLIPLQILLHSPDETKTKTKTKSSSANTANTVMLPMAFIRNQDPAKDVWNHFLLNCRKSK